MFRTIFRFPVFRRLAAFMALVAMLVPMGTALIHHPAPPPAMAGMAAMTGMADCGMMGKPASSGKEQTPAHKLPACPICQSLHLLGIGFVSPLPPALLLLIATILAVVSFAFFPHLFHRIGAPQARPRAPPFFLA